MRWALVVFALRLSTTSLPVAAPVAEGHDERSGNAVCGADTTDDASRGAVIGATAGGTCKSGHAACGAKCCPREKACVLPPPSSAKHRHRHARCECVAPHKHCPSGCVAIDSDPKDCGACRHACAAGTVCSDGQCVPG